MGVTKNELYTAEHIRLATVCKAIGHPARLAILQKLLEVRGCICKDLTEELGLAQPTVSRHLHALKDANLIVGEVTGTKVCYCINPIGWKEIQAWFTTISTQTNCCE